MSKKLSRKNSIKRKNLRKRNSMKRSRKNKKLRGGANKELKKFWQSILDKKERERRGVAAGQTSDMPSDLNLQRSQSAINRNKICKIIQDAGFTTEGLYNVKLLRDGEYKVNSIEDECKNI